MKESILNITEEFNADISQASGLHALEEIRLKFLSRKGKVTQLFETFKTLPPEEKKTVW
jgi:phenylalanyl-tRNA synthetase alpha chain